MGLNIYKLNSYCYLREMECDFNRLAPITTIEFALIDVFIAPDKFLQIKPCNFVSKHTTGKSNRTGIQLLDIAKRKRREI